jgi:hypothetical protein
LYHLPNKLEQLLPSYTVRVISGDSKGTGFFVAPGLILTCARVVKDLYDPKRPTAKPITVLWNTQQYSAQIREQEYFPSPYPDLALIHADELLEPPCVYLDNDVQLSDELYSYGYVVEHEAGAPALFRYEGPADRADLLQLKEARDALV